MLANVPGPDAGALVGVESPLTNGRSVVALLGGSPEAVDALVTTLRDPDQAPIVQGDLALLAGGRFTSYRVGSEYSAGQLPFWLYPFRGGSLGLLGLIIVGLLLLLLVLAIALRRRRGPVVTTRRR